MLKRLDKAPFPWFGGKSQAADTVWPLLGDVCHYVEPFAGSLAMLLRRPHPCNRPYYSETINDLDGFVVNFWRAVQWHPEETARHASWPVSEADKQARQIACLKWRTDKMLDLLAGSAEWCDPKIAGWWAYGVCCQIGAVTGPWTADPVTGRIYKQPLDRTREPGVLRNRPHLGNNGRGVNHAGTREPGVSRNRPHLHDNGQGVNRPGTREPGVTPLDSWPDDERFHDLAMPELIRWFRYLCARLRHVRIVNGDWRRVCTKGAAHTIPVRAGKGQAGFFLDPPYDREKADRAGVYEQDEAGIADAVCDWCLANGDDPYNRIVLAGYDIEHTELEKAGWTVHEWYKEGHLTGGYGNMAKGRGTGDHQQHRERLWASPHCITPSNGSTQRLLWDTVEA